MHLPASACGRDLHDFAGWKKVDAFERSEGAKEGREHKKVVEPDQMRELAHA